MAEFSNDDLTDARFDAVRLNNARFHDVDLSGASFRLVDLTGVSIRGAAVVDVEINGEVENLRVNGVDVAPFVQAELNRRYPERAMLRPATAAGYREIWPVLERLWAQTMARARGLSPDQLHERVDGEWSFIETQRHLVFATDSWVRRALLGDPSPWDQLDLPHDEMPDMPGVVPRDRAARPGLDEVLALRADRMATVRHVIADLTDEQLGGSTDPVLAPGFPEPESYSVSECLQCILVEEWHHRWYAERDLDILQR